MFENSLNKDNVFDLKIFLFVCFSLYANILIAAESDGYVFFLVRSTRSG